MAQFIVLPWALPGGNEKGHYDSWSLVQTETGET